MLALTPSIARAEEVLLLDFPGDVKVRIRERFKQPCCRPG